MIKKTKRINITVPIYALERIDKYAKAKHRMLEVVDFSLEDVA